MPVCHMPVTGGKPMAEQLFKKKITREEKIYLDAVGLQEAVSCVLRFERKVNALNSAAKKFESLGDYKDARARMESCREQAAAVEVEGARETYELALRKKEAAVKKSDYIDAIEEFRRLKKRDDYREEAMKQIQFCKKKIAHLERVAVWKRRLILLAVLVASAVIFIKTPAYPFTKGFIHQQMGEYKAAIANFEEASAIPWSKDLKASCHYHLGMKELKKGHKRKALGHFKKASRLERARVRAERLEEELMKDGVK